MEELSMGRGKRNSVWMALILMVVFVVPALADAREKSG
jgi:hypothetical protein